MIANGIVFNLSFCPWCFIFFFKTYLFILERQQAGAAGGAKGENPQADSPLTAEPAVRLDPRTLRS